MRIVLAMIVLCMAAVPMDATAQQSASSGIIGQVLDSTHAGVPGATVTATNMGTGAQRVGVTDAKAGIRFPRSAGDLSGPGRARRISTPRSPAWCCAAARPCART